MKQKSIEPQGMLQGFGIVAKEDPDNKILSQLYRDSKKDDSLKVCALYLPPKPMTVILQDKNSKGSFTQ